MIDNMPNEWWRSIILCGGDVEPATVEQKWTETRQKISRRGILTVKYRETRKINI
jgi:hypothetical protein